MVEIKAGSRIKSLEHEMETYTETDGERGDERDYLSAEDTKVERQLKVQEDNNKWKYSLIFYSFVAVVFVLVWLFNR